MVVLLDLDEDSINDPYHAGSFDAIGHTLTQRNDTQYAAEVRDEQYATEARDEVERVNPNLNSFSAALSCYP